MMTVVAIYLYSSFFPLTIVIILFKNKVDENKRDMTLCIFFFPVQAG